MINGTLGILAHGDIIVVSECKRALSGYERSAWIWPNKSQFADGYILGNSAQTVELPYLSIQLESDDDAFPLCGSIVYQLIDHSSSTSVATFI